MPTYTRSIRVRRNEIRITLFFYHSVYRRFICIIIVIIFFFVSFHCLNEHSFTHCSLCTNYYFNISYSYKSNSWHVQNILQQREARAYFAFMTKAVRLFFFLFFCSGSECLLTLIYLDVFIFWKIVSYGTGCVFVWLAGWLAAGTREGQRERVGQPTEALKMR